jgi:hypothetical protein
VVGILLGKKPQHLGEILPLIQRGIEQKNFLHAAIRRVTQAGANEFRRQEVLPVIALGVVAEFAIEDAAAGGFQQQHFLLGGVENARQVRRSQAIDVRHRRTHRRLPRRIEPRPGRRRHIQAGDRRVKQRQCESTVRGSVSLAM